MHAPLQAHLQGVGQADTSTRHQLSCGHGDQTREHVLQACPLFDHHRRKDVWSDETDLETKLWGTADRTASACPPD